MSVTVMIGGFFVHHDIDVDQPIYRCIKIRHLDDFFNKKYLYFRNVTKWEDTWEIPSRFLQTENPIIQSTNFVSPDFYGTCWTKTTVSDALWRIYSGPEKDGICIETTPRKLMQSIDFSFRAKGFVDGFIAPVRYEQLSDTPPNFSFFTKESEYYPMNMVPAFIKRKAFEHEQEIRFIIHVPHPAPNNLLHIEEDKSSLLLPFKDLNFVNRLIVDPRLTKQEFDNIEMKYSHFNKEIVKSTLYDTPEELYDILLNSGWNDIRYMKDLRWWKDGDFKSFPPKSSK